MKTWYQNNIYIKLEHYEAIQFHKSPFVAFLKEDFLRFNFTKDPIIEFLENKKY